MPQGFHGFAAYRAWAFIWQKKEITMKCWAFKKPPQTMN